jgi:hypothetical protein
VIAIKMHGTKTDEKYINMERTGSYVRKTGISLRFAPDAAFVVGCGGRENEQEDGAWKRGVP